MRNNIFVIALITVIGFASCAKEATTPIPQASSKPEGTFTATKTGSFVAAPGEPAAGTAQIGTDTKSTQFVKFGTDFKSSFSTGAVTVIMSKTANYEPASGQVVSLVSVNGEQFFKVTPSVSSEFKYVILWCSAARVPFGSAELK